MLLNKPSQRHNPLLGHGNMMPPRMHHRHRTHAPIHQGPTPPLLDHRVQTPYVMQHGRLNPRLVQKLQRRHRRPETGVRHGKLDGPPAIRLPQPANPSRRRGGFLVPLVLFPCRRGYRPGGLQRGGDETRRGGALAEAADAVYAVCLGDGVRNGRHALLQEGVRAGGVVPAPPRPRIGLVVVVVVVDVVLTGGHITRYVLQDEPVWRGGIDELRGEGKGREDFGEELFQGAGFGVEEGP